MFHRWKDIRREVSAPKDQLALARERRARRRRRLEMSQEDLGGERLLLGALGVGIIAATVLLCYLAVTLARAMGVIQ
jgi:hypothetical protein